MNGPQHYAAAERLVESMRQEMAGSPGTPLRTHDQQVRLAAEAQVHATLALAAAAVAARGFGPLESWGGHHIETLDPSWAEVTA